MSVPLSYYLLLAAILFTIGMVGVIVRRNALVVLMSIELMINASIQTLIAYSRFRVDLVGNLLALFIIAVTAAGAALGLTIVINLNRLFGSTDLDQANTLQG